MEEKKNSAHNILAPFLKALHAEGLSENTIEAYRMDLKDFGKWYLETIGEDLKPELVTGIDLAEYRQHLIQWFKPATVNRRFASISKWLKWASSQGFIPSAPAMPKLAKRERLAPGL